MLPAKAGSKPDLELDKRLMRLMTFSSKAVDLFPGRKRNAGLSHIAMAKVLERMGAGNVTVHGFRSTFRDWTGDRTQYPREIAEAALAHIIGNKAEQAYRRGDALEKRRALMNDWAAYLTGQS